MTTDSIEYQHKKGFFDRLLTIYGRKPVLEALQDSTLDIYKIHLAESNKQNGIVSDIIRLAEQRQIDIRWHDRKALSRISRNGKQDQGVAADIQIESHQTLDQFLEHCRSNQHPYKLIALDRITNPQNLGMIIRSVCAGNIDGLILPRQGCAALSPLVVKASVGTLFKCRILHCDDLISGLKQAKQHDGQICTLSSHVKNSLFDYKPAGNTVYILGNETEGVSKEVAQLSDKQLSIPMHNGVESLNVAITAALIAFNQ